MQYLEKELEFHANFFCNALRQQPTTSLQKQSFLHINHEADQRRPRDRHQAQSITLRDFCSQAPRHFRKVIREQGGNCENV